MRSLASVARAALEESRPRFSNGLFPFFLAYLLAGLAFCAATTLLTNGALGVAVLILLIPYLVFGAANAFTWGVRASSKSTRWTGHQPVALNNVRRAAAIGLLLALVIIAIGSFFVWLAPDYEFISYVVMYIGGMLGVQMGGTICLDR